MINIHYVQDMELGAKAFFNEYIRKLYIKFLSIELLGNSKKANFPKTSTQPSHFSNGKVK